MLGRLFRTLLLEGLAVGAVAALVLNGGDATSAGTPREANAASAAHTTAGSTAARTTTDARRLLELPSSDPPAAEAVLGRERFVEARLDGAADAAGRMLDHELNRLLEPFQRLDRKDVPPTPGTAAASSRN